jgi:hypothetical protein
MPNCYNTVWRADGLMWGELIFPPRRRSRVCRRRLLLDYVLPTLQRHGDVWIYHFPERHQVSIRCPHGDTHSEVLHDTGIIHGATSCSIATSKVRTLHELHVSVGVRLDIPDIYLPDLPPIVTAHELPQIEQTASVKTDGVDFIQRHLAASPRFLDVDTLLHVHQMSLSSETHAYLEWIVPSSTVVCCLVLILCFACRTQISHYVRCHASSKSPESNTVPQDSVSLTASSLPPAEYNASECSRNHVAFTNYGLHHSV